MNNRRYLWTLVPCAMVLVLAAWLRGAEYDEQYTLFLTSGVPRPDWPATVFPAGLAREIQSGHSGLLAIAHDLRATDVHPPLYFWLIALWRDVLGSGLFTARLLSVVLGLAAVGLTGMIARLARLPPVWAMLLTLGCYGFTYTSVIARGFALAQLLLLAGAAGLLLGRRYRHFALAGALFGAATLTNYLAVFTACACLFAAMWRLWWVEDAGVPLPSWRGSDRAISACVPAPGADISSPESDGERRANHSGTAVQRPAHNLGHVTAAVLGFLVFIPADLWWFLAQRGSRQGQFQPFSIVQSVARLAIRMGGGILGGLPLYVPGGSRIIAAALGLVLLGLGASIFWRWRRIGRAPARVMFALATIAPAAGLLALGAIFNNTPIEVRYLAFAMPFAALLLAGALRTPAIVLLLAVQSASIAGLMLAPQTMQPARAAAHAAAALAEDGVVLLPRGNDGVGIVGAFAIEAPPALPLLLIPDDATTGQIRFLVASWHRVVLALVEQDDASRAAAETMRRVLVSPDWREVARRPNVAVYERRDP